jgi:hypothetical protein
VRALEGTRRSPVGKNELWFFERFTVQKSYNRSGKLGILGLLGIRKINNLRIINTPCKTDPDQVHQLINNLADLPHSAWPEIGRKFQEASAIAGFSLSS